MQTENVNLNPKNFITHYSREAKKHWTKLRGKLYTNEKLVKMVLQLNRGERVGSMIMMNTARNFICSIFIFIKFFTDTESRYSPASPHDINKYASLLRRYDALSATASSLETELTYYKNRCRHLERELQRISNYQFRRASDSAPALPHSFPTITTSRPLSAPIVSSMAALRPPLIPPVHPHSEESFGDGDNVYESVWKKI